MSATSGQPLTKQTLSGFKWSSLSTVIQFSLQFACFTVLAHLLGPREFGIVGTATVFTNFIERVGFLGVGQALVQRENLTARHIQCGFVLCVVFGACLFALFYFGAPAIGRYFEQPELVAVLRVVGLSFLFASVAEVPLCLMQRELKFKQLLVVTNVGFLIGNGIVGITLALLGYSYWALVAAIVVGRFVRMCLAFRARPQRMSLQFSLQEVKELLSIGVGFSLGRLTNYVALVGDNFVTSKLLGPAALGLYSRAYQMMTAPATYFGQVLEKVLFSALSQRQGEPAKIARYYLFGVELCSIVSVGGAVVLSTAAPEIVTVLFGPQWLGAVPAVQVLAMGVFFRTCYKNSDTVIRALGAVYRLAFRQTLYAAVVITGSIFGSRWGIEGVAAAVLFAVFLNYAMLSYLCCRLLSVSAGSFGRAHLSAAWIGSWQYLAIRLSLGAAHDAQWSSVPSLAAGLTAMGVATVLALVLCPPVFRPKVSVWIGRNVALERFGIIGRLGKQFLLRGTTPATVS